MHRPDGVQKLGNGSPYPAKKCLARSVPAIRRGAALGGQDVVEGSIITIVFYEERESVRK